MRPAYLDSRRVRLTKYQLENIALACIAGGALGTMALIWWLA